MTTLNLDRTFEQTEKEGEIFAAIARIVIALVILLAAWMSRDAGHAGHPLKMIAVFYAITSVVGLFLAYKKIFHLIIPYGFVTIDMAVIALALTMLAQMHNLSLSHEFSLPLFSLAFVILIHAALRYRPLLILFGFLLFVVLLFALPIAINFPIVTHSEAAISHPHSSNDVAEIILHDVGFLPLLFLTLAMALLFYIVMRTRSITELALIDGRRANQLSRFFSPEIANSLGSMEAEEIQSGNRQNVAIIFIDVCGFSKLAENLPPEAVAEFLSAFRTKICDIVFKYNGTIDKFTGDGVLAVFGAPIVRKDDAQRAVEASIEIRDEIKKWHQQRDRDGLPGADVGIGGHFGEVFSGIIESGQILEHSVIGDTVNVAERLERITRDLKANFVFSDALMASANFEIGPLEVQSMEDVEIRGHNGRVKIWYG